MLAVKENILASNNFERNHLGSFHFRVTFTSIKNHNLTILFFFYNSVTNYLRKYLPAKVQRNKIISLFKCEIRKGLVPFCLGALTHQAEHSDNYIKLSFNSDIFTGLCP